MGLGMATPPTGRVPLGGTESFDVGFCGVPAPGGTFGESLEVLGFTGMLGTRLGEFVLASFSPRTPSLFTGEGWASPSTCLALGRTAGLFANEGKGRESRSEGVRDTVGAGLAGGASVRCVRWDATMPSTVETTRISGTDIHARE